MNEEKNAHDAHKNAPNTPEQGGGAKESKLDRWIRQNVLGEHKPEEKIIHQPAPGKNGHQNEKPGVPKTPPKNETPPKKGGFFFGRRKKQEQPSQAAPQGKGPAHMQRPAHTPPESGVRHGHQVQAYRAPINRPAPNNRQAPPGRPTPGNRPMPAVTHGPGPVTHHPQHPLHQHFQGKLRIIPLGGLNEVGKNCTIFEYGNDIIIVDLGFQFPDEDMLGVDYVIPDIRYLQDKLDRIRGIIFTHGHLDHIGAVPYLIPKLNFPQMFGTKLTMGLVEKRLEEFGLQKEAKMRTITADDTLQLGVFSVGFFRVNHSIPDSVGCVIKTPAGNIVHTGDFKFDFTPSGDQLPADFSRIASFANQNIAALFIDSTNALKPGYTVSESKIGNSLENIIKNIEGRIIIASFASQIGRIQQIINIAQKYDRTIFLSGRSLIDNCYMAKELGYLKVPEGLVHDVRKVKKIPGHKALILTTGSQGEDVSALTRMALEEHPAVKIAKGDTVVLSSSPIPGNERAIATVTNNLSRLGARVINNQIMDVHASGHAQQEDLKLMMNLVKPKYIVPIHGEFHMRYGAKEVAMTIGYDESHTLLIENGDVLEIENNEVKTKDEKVSTNYVLIDGLGVGDIGAQVIMDRQTLAENGVLIVLIPVDEKTRKLKGEIDIVSRGFIYMKESEEIIKAIQDLAAESYRKIIEKRADLKRGEIKKYLRESIDKLVHQKIERHPLVIPIIVEM